MDRDLRDALEQISLIGRLVRNNTEDGLSDDDTLRQMKKVSTTSYDKLKTVIDGLDTKDDNHEKLELILKKVKEIRDLAKNDTDQEDSLYYIGNLWNKIESSIENLVENC